MKLKKGFKKKTKKKVFKKEIKTKIKKKISPLSTLPTLKRIKPKQGKWCSYYEGRLPFPIECASNRDMLEVSYFKDKKKYVLKDFSECKNCKRYPVYSYWKRGDWDHIIKLIKENKDLREMNPPDQENLV